MSNTANPFFLKGSNPRCPIDFYLHPLQRPSLITQPEVRAPTKVTNKVADEDKCRPSNSISPSIPHQLGLPGAQRNVASDLSKAFSLKDTNPCCPIDFYLHPLQRPSHITQPEVRAPTEVTNKAADEDKCRPSNSISLSMSHQLGLPGVQRNVASSLALGYYSFSKRSTEIRCFIFNLFRLSGFGFFLIETPIRAVPLISICIHYSDLLTSPSQWLEPRPNKAADEDKCRPSNSISPSMPHQLGLPGVRRNMASIVKN
ncbi:hypothetical protein CEXT_395791 [Caerostris extrusa]|uniref:Uncharacterized protein n=1 Tax=Caerostris extrusa TaxID=172846 RepID=A0AAV4P177_CAEEX|nr:hypothetical protein CEXT_395791 [Caerostris extrusa]